MQSARVLLGAGASADCWDSQSRPSLGSAPCAVVATLEAHRNPGLVSVVASAVGIPKNYNYNTVDYIIVYKALTPHHVVLNY